MPISVSSPFPAHAWPQAWLWLEPIRDRVFDDYAPRNLEDFVEFGEALKGQTWGVYRDGELGGLIVVESHGDLLRRIQIFFKRSFWGRDTTVPAVEQVLRIVFSGKARKVTTFPFADNHAMRAFLLSLNFKLEGTLRKQGLRGGHMVDLLAFGLLKEELTYAIRPGGGFTRGGRLGAVGDSGRQASDHDHDTHVLIGTTAVAGEPIQHPQLTACESD